MIFAVERKGSECVKQNNTYNQVTGEYKNPENKSLGEIYKEGMTKGFSDGYEAGYRRALADMGDDGK